VIDVNRLPKYVLAPLAGYTDAGFRRLAKKYGCDMTVTEMVSAKALTMGNSNTFSLLFFDEDGQKSVQLFGHEPAVFAEAVQHPLIAPFDVVDVNMGCPQRKIAGNGDGCALMDNPKVATAIIKAIKSHTDKPVSVKFRKGYGNKNTAVDFAKACCDAGVDFITVHGRTSNMQFGGVADWQVIAQVVQAVNVPVYANGDVADVESCKRVFEETGCFGVSIGRGAIGKPYLFAQLKGQAYDFDLYADLKEHVEVLQKIYPEKMVANEIKKHVVNYTKGRRGAKQLITSVMQMKTPREVLDAVREFLTFSNI